MRSVRLYWTLSATTTCPTSRTSSKTQKHPAKRFLSPIPVNSPQTISHLKSSPNTFRSQTHLQLNISLDATQKQVPSQPSSHSQISKSKVGLKTILRRPHRRAEFQKSSRRAYPRARNGKWNMCRTSHCWNMSKRLWSSPGTLFSTESTGRKSQKERETHIGSQESLTNHDKSITWLLKTMIRLTMISPP